MPEQDGDLPTIRWADRSCRREDLEIEENLRFLAGHGMAPELARDVVFWLDLGRPPRDVAHWLRRQLASRPGDAGEPGSAGERGDPGETGDPGDVIDLRTADAPAAEKPERDVPPARPAPAAGPPEESTGWVLRRRRRASRSRRR